ncbi:Riboflavin synthase eubacterial/eukaryotic [Serinicoccus hydrothermalis]|uniref:Riboflavin synthase n=1 Tax=Serinicoccus hydrothermalis TaxID=1758689 RepID=A0A1B1NFF1_9MICO|nr:riboflavin synthase [Serinicoccus hydrothermalis]ANS80157.1 Riboflavin synthase eubacterial/eukaryotic [Serinicoccus hydrothermalis]
MFTGIVEELGSLVSRTDGTDASVVEVRGPLVVADAANGASIAVNGVCLTVTRHTEDGFTADVMAETLAVTTLGGLAPGDPVNLERSLPGGGRLGGHVVQGHVDGTTTVLSRTPGERWEVVRLALPPQLARYVAHKGSVALDGVSLTVSALGPDWFEVSLIPTTLDLTTLGVRGPGQAVNVEVDVLAKYAERLLDPELAR